MPTGHCPEEISSLICAATCAGNGTPRWGWVSCTSKPPNVGHLDHTSVCSDAGRVAFQLTVALITAPQVDARAGGQ